MPDHLAEGLDRKVAFAQSPGSNPSPRWQEPRPLQKHLVPSTGCARALERAWGREQRCLWQRRSDLTSKVDGRRP